MTTLDDQSLFQQNATLREELAKEAAERARADGRATAAQEKAAAAQLVLDKAQAYDEALAMQQRAIQAEEKSQQLAEQRAQVADARRRASWRYKVWAGQPAVVKGIMILAVLVFVGICGFGLIVTNGALLGNSPAATGPEKAMMPVTVRGGAVLYLLPDEGKDSGYRVKETTTTYLGYELDEPVGWFLISVGGQPYYVKASDVVQSSGAQATATTSTGGNVPPTPDVLNPCVAMASPGVDWYCYPGAYSPFSKGMYAYDWYRKALGYSKVDAKNPNGAFACLWRSHWSAQNQATYNTGQPVWLFVNAQQIATCGGVK